MTDIELIKKDVLEGKQIDKDAAMELYAQPLEILCRCADEIRRFLPRSVRRLEMARAKRLADQDL